MLPHKHIVLDLDETLIHSLSRSKAMQLLLEKPEYVGRMFAIDIPGYHSIAIKRPFLDEFLAFCFRSYATVSVWTAGTKEYAEAVVSSIFSASKPHLVYHRGMCKKKDGLYEKHLTQMAVALDCSVSEMLLVDDNPAAKRVNGTSALQVPPWEAPARLSLQDNLLFLLMCKWVIEAAYSTSGAQAQEEAQAITVQA